MMNNTQAIANFKINHLHHHIYCTNKDHAVTSLNNTQATDCGFDDYRIAVGKYVYDFYKNAEIIVENNESILKTGDAKIFREKLVLNDDSVITYISHKFPVRNNKGKITGVMGMSVPAVNFDNKKLSHQQSTCLSLLCKGMTAREIAHQMQLSIRTVEHYISAIKVKLNVKSTKALIAKYSLF